MSFFWPRLKLIMTPSLRLATLPVMGPEATSDFFTIDGTIQSTNSSAYLTIAAGDTSYKTLRFADSSAGGDVWALEGDTIITGQGSSWGRRKLPSKQFPPPPISHRGVFCLLALQQGEQRGEELIDAPCVLLT